MKYPLPATNAPLQWRKICIEVPADADWHANFIGALYQLTRWYAHAEDADKRARLVANQWERTFSSVLALTDCEEGDCMSDCACDELKLIRALLERGFYIAPIQGDPPDSLPDCGDAPPNFGDNPDDPTQDKQKRLLALCDALQKWLAEATIKIAAAANADASFTANLAAGIEAVLNAPAFAWFNNPVTVAANMLQGTFTLLALQAIVEEGDAYHALLCMLMEKLAAQPTSYATWRTEWDTIKAEVDPDIEGNLNLWLLVNWLHPIAVDQKNYKAFESTLKKAFEQELQPDDCPCDTEPPAPPYPIIVPGDDPAGQATTVTDLGAGLWEISGGLAIPQDSNRVHKVFRSQDYTCVHFEPAEGTISMWAHAARLCDDTIVQGAGGVFPIDAKLIQTQDAPPTFRILVTWIP